MERHGGGLIIEPVVFRIVVAVYADLEFQHLESGELHEEVAVDGELRERKHALVGAFLIVYGIVPVEYAEFQELLEACGENLHVASMLLGKRLAVEVNEVLHVLHPGTDGGTCPWNMKLTSDLICACLAEVVVPGEMIGNVVLEKIGLGEVVEIGVGGNPHGIAEKLELCGDLSVKLHVADHIADHAEFSACGIFQNLPAVFLQTPSDPKEIARGSGGDVEVVGQRC